MRQDLVIMSVECVNVCVCVVCATWSLLPPSPPDLLCESFKGTSKLLHLVQVELIDLLKVLLKCLLELDAFWQVTLPH